MAMVDTAVVAPAVTRVVAEAQEQFDPCFLRAEAIGDYLDFISSDATAPDPRFSIFSGPPDWSTGKGPFPLALCEFLAYKTVLAYASDEDISAHLSNCRGIDIASYKFFDSRRRRLGDTQGYGFVLGDTAFIVMRGSASLRDWIDDFMALPTTAPRFLVRQSTLQRIGGKDPERHLGFARAWANAAVEIKQWIQELPGRGFSVKHLCFSGHSLGGALAVMGAFELTRQRIEPAVAAVVTFAAPPVGGKQFRETYESIGLAGRTVRVESVEDAVPKVPVYGPVGQQWLITKRPMIGRAERIWATLLGLAGWTTRQGSAVQTSQPSETQAAIRPETAMSGSTSSTTSPNQAPKEQSARDNRNGLLIIIGVAATVAVYLITRRIVMRYRAHGAAKRYALYLTTRSYQQIRSFRVTGPGAASEGDLIRASIDLDRHLDFIRGPEPRKSAYAALKGYPIRVLTNKDVEKFTRETTKAEKDVDPPYAGYIW